MEKSDVLSKEVGNVECNQPTVITIEVSPIIERSKVGDPLPDTTTYEYYSILERGFDPELYRRNLKRVFHHKDANVCILDHFNFISWFEGQLCKKNQIEWLSEYTFALSGIGLFRAEQKTRLKFLKLDYQNKNLIFRNPTPKFYPEVLPLSIYQLLKIINQLFNGSREWKNNLQRRAKLMALFWQSKRVDFFYNTTPGAFAIDYLCKYIGISDRMTVNNDLTFLEKFQLIKCIKHGYKTTTQPHPTYYPNIYNINIQNTQYSYPLIYIPYPIPMGIKCVRNWDSMNYKIDALAKTIYLKSVYLFETDTKKRRSTQPEAKTKIHSSEKRLYWQVIKGSKQLIERKTDLMIKNIQTLKIDRELLNQDIKKFELCIQHETDKQIKEKYDYEMQLCKNLVETGISTRFRYTRTGRLKVEGIANHLNNSMRCGKKGYSFWGALHQNELYKADIKSAEILMISIVTGDKRLFENIMEGDIYMQMVDMLGLPKEASYRKLVKDLWLRFQYGKSINSIRENEPENLELFKKLHNHLKVTYPEYYKGIHSLVQIGGAILKKGIRKKLPNEFYICLEPGHPYPLPAHIMQAYVSVITAKLFLYLYEHNYQPVFEQHDAVITTKPMNNNINDRVKEEIQWLLRLHNLDWQIPENYVALEIEQLIFDEQSNSFEIRDKAASGSRKNIYVTKDAKEVLYNIPLH
jgi:hypothetical protein